MARTKKPGPSPRPRVAVVGANLAVIFTATGLPEPEEEFRFSPDRRWRFDFAWPRYKVAFEREGETWSGKGRHVRGAGYRRDVDKYNEAALLGWLVIRATADMLRDGSALLVVGRALVERGFRPRPREEV
jgi:hypothetical protein